MIDPTEPLSLVIWAVFALSAGMYPLGFMLGSCSPCCGGEDSDACNKCVDQFEFKRCVRFEAKVKPERSGRHVYRIGGDGGLYPESSEPVVSPLHGFSRSIGRPEDVGAKRVVAKADVTATFSTYYTALKENSFPLEVRLVVWTGGTVNFSQELETLYTWTIERSTTATSKTEVETSDTATTITYPAAEIDAIIGTTVDYYGQLTLSLTARNVRRTSHCDFGWDEWTDHLSVVLVGGLYAGYDTAVSACINSYEYHLKLADANRLRFWSPGQANPYGSQPWVYDAEEVLKFLNGEESQTYVDHGGVEWDVTIQGDTPLCGLSIGSGANSLVPYMVTAELPSECPGQTWKYDMYGCSGFGVRGTIGGGGSPLAYPLVRDRFPALINPPERMTFNSFLQSGAPYIENDISSCGYEIYDAPSCTSEGQIRRTLSGGAFFCGDLLWTVENGPCNTTYEQARVDGETETYTLNESNERQHDAPYGRLLCPFVGQSLGGNLGGQFYFQSENWVGDYPPVDEDCWPKAMKFTFAYHENCPGYENGFKPVQCANSYLGGFGYGWGWARGCPEGWAQSQLEYRAELYAVQGCRFAYYRIENGSLVSALIRKNCDGSFSIQNPGVGAGRFPDMPYIGGHAPLPPDAENLCDPADDVRDLAFFPLISVEEMESGDEPYEFAVTSITPDEIPAEGGTVTIVTDGVQSRESQVTFGPNLSRFSIVRVVYPPYIHRETQTDPSNPRLGVGINYVDFNEYNPIASQRPAAVITQKGYGGDEDDQCISDPIWVNASAVQVPVRSALNAGVLPAVFKDFTQERCLICQPTTLEGTTCEWEATGSEPWMKIEAKDGLFTLTIDPEAEYTVGPVYGYPTGLTGDITISTPKESKTWTVFIKVEE